MLSIGSNRTSSSPSAVLLELPLQAVQERAKKKTVEYACKECMRVTYSRVLEFSQHDTYRGTDVRNGNKTYGHSFFFSF